MANDRTKELLEIAEKYKNYQALQKNMEETGLHPNDIKKIMNIVSHHRKIVPVLQRQDIQYDPDDIKLIAAYENANLIPYKKRFTRLEATSTDDGKNKEIQSRFASALRSIGMTHDEYQKSNIKHLTTKEIEDEILLKKEILCSMILSEPENTTIRQENEIAAASLGVSLEKYLASSMDPKDRKYHVLQLHPEDSTSDLQFISSDELAEMGQTPKLENYIELYSGVMPDGCTLENLYQYLDFCLRECHSAYNTTSKDFKGHSLSVSDIVVIEYEECTTANYVDEGGFKQYPEFAQQYAREKQKSFIKKEMSSIKEKLDRATEKTASLPKSTNKKENDHAK